MTTFISSPHTPSEQPLRFVKNEVNSKTTKKEENVFYCSFYKAMSDSTTSDINIGVRSENQQVSLQISEEEEEEEEGDIYELEDEEPFSWDEIMKTLTGMDDFFTKEQIESIQNDTVLMKAHELFVTKHQNKRQI